MKASPEITLTIWLGKMFEADYPVLQDYHVEMSKAFLDDQRNDIISGELGMLSQWSLRLPGSL